MTSSKKLKLYNKSFPLQSPVLQVTTLAIFHIPLFFIMLSLHLYIYLLIKQSVCGIFVCILAYVCIHTHTYTHTHTHTRASLVAQMVNSLNPQYEIASFQSLDREDSLENEMAAHSSILAWRIPWTEEPGGLQSTGWQSQTQLSN